MFICPLECSIRGCNPIVHHDPTPAQYAAFWNKEKGLQMIIGLSKGIPFDDVFNPPHSNTKGNLLVLTIQNPEWRTNCLKFLLDGRRSGELPFDLAGALPRPSKGAGPNWAAASLRIVGPGKQGETLHKIFADMGCLDLAKLVSRRQMHAPRRRRRDASSASQSKTCRRARRSFAQTPWTITSSGPHQRPD
jgi:hypothetical protein